MSQRRVIHSASVGSEMVYQCHNIICITIIIACKQVLWSWDIINVDGVAYT